MRWPIVFQRAGDRIPLITMVNCRAHLLVEVALRRYCLAEDEGNASQFVLPSLTLLSEAGCGRLYMELPIGLLQ